LKEKDMKRTQTVLVLLVMWSLLSIASLSSAATTGEIPKDQDSSDVSTQHDLIIHVTGAVDDDQDGDPGDAGDGYGISDQTDGLGSLSGNGDLDKSILGEFMLILMAMIQLAL